VLSYIGPAVNESRLHVHTVPVTVRGTVLSASEPFP
jgi:hypothetical protein